MSVTDKVHDVVTIGAGPAALSCSIYTAREDLETLMLEKGVIGGLVATTDTVENYPGFPEPVTGLDLSDLMRKQAERFGVNVELAEVSGIKTDEGIKVLDTTSGDIKAKSVLIATGSDYKKLGIPGEEEFYGRGVHYCATCDGALYRDKKLVVVGGGNSAAQESLFLTKFASHIDVLIRSDHWKAQETMVKQIEAHEKITVHFNIEAQEFVGSDTQLNKIKAINNQTKEKIDFEADGAFVFIGLIPNTKFLESSDVELDEWGFIKADEDLQTNLDGVYVAGDVRSGSEQQIAIAAGEGVLAALRIREYLNENH